jgi:hypothetical protein
MKQMKAFRQPRPFVKKIFSRAEKKTTALKTSMMGAPSRRERAVTIRRLEIVAGKVGKPHEVEIVEITH